VDQVPRLWIDRRDSGLIRIKRSASGSTRDARVAARRSTPTVQRTPDAPARQPGQRDGQHGRHSDMVRERNELEEDAEHGRYRLGAAAIVLLGEPLRRGSSRPAATSAAVAASVAHTKPSQCSVRMGSMRMSCLLPGSASGPARGRDRCELDSHQGPARAPMRSWRPLPNREERPMTHATLRIIREEHAAMAAMLRSILLLLEQARRQATLPDFAALRAMIFYVDEFPEKKHHRKESELLFPKLRARTPRSREVLDQLEQDHARGEGRIRDLEHALLGFEMLGEPRRVAFETAAARYVEFYLAHMALEEREILPLAERCLTPQDWVDLDEAFAQNRDPLTGHAPEPDYRALFTRIVNLVPAPIGLGPPRASPAPAPAFDHHPQTS
jgi:hemerythrin-like domain-containing protein